VDLREPLTTEIRDEIYAALLRYKVIFFRDQPLTREQHIALGSAFGELEAHPVEPTAGYPLILEVKADGVIKRGPDIWHTDNMYEAVPPSVSILRALTIPSSAAIRSSPTRSRPTKASTPIRRARSST